MAIEKLAADFFPEMPVEDVRFFVEMVANSMAETGNDVAAAVELSSRKVQALGALAISKADEMADIVYDALRS